jgi:putative flavoprotein involved in K+ transport
MPEMHFRVRWPHGIVEDCYSPSTVVERYLTPGQSYPIEDFVARARVALNLASERVQARYGFACSSALDQLRAIEATAAAVPPGTFETRVEVLAITQRSPRNARVNEPEHFPVAIVGAGQAGLSVSYLLKQRGIPHVVLEANRVAHAWRRERWDAFCLVTPNWQCQLPGHPYSGCDPHGFMLKDEIVAYVESYAKLHDLPVREGIRVLRLAAGEHHPFLLDTGASPITADRVVVATGGYHRPRVPVFAGSFPAHITQLHSSAYRNSAALPPGDVLVVGTGQSGAQIAEDLLLEGRTVHLSVGSAPRCARFYRGRDVVDWLHDMGHYDAPIPSQSNPDDLRERANHYVSGRSGGRDLDLRDFALRGMKLYGPLRGIHDGTLRFEPSLKRNLDAADDVYRRINRSIDEHIARNNIPAPPVSVYAPPWEPTEEPTELALADTQIASVVFCTGFDVDFSWIDAGVLDHRGQPRHLRGVTSKDGLYFIGLPWLHTWGSGRFAAVGRDAAYIVEHMVGAERPVRPQSFEVASGVR